MIRATQKVAKILGKRQRIGIIIIGIMMLIGGTLETLGVSLMVPFVDAIMTDDFMNNKYVRMVNHYIHIEKSETFIILMIVTLMMVFIIKNAFLMFEYYVQFRFVCKNKFRLQKKMMYVFVNKPYEYYLNTSTSEVLRIVGNDADAAFSLLTTVLNFYTEFVIAIFLILAVVIASPLLAAMVGIIMCLLMLIVFKIVKPILHRAAVMRMDNLTMQNKWFLQTIEGIKEVKVSTREDFFLGKYFYYGEKTLETEQKNNIVSTMPRMIIETFGVCGMLGAVLIMILSGCAISSLWTQLAAFALAAIRLLPSVNRMSTAMNMVNYYEPMIESLMNNLELVNSINNGEIVEEKKESSRKISVIKDKIQLHNISYHYPNSEVYVLKNAEMEIPIGKSVGIVGTSGAGKTTAVDILLGLLVPQEGEVLADGINIKEDYVGWLTSISYIPQNIFLLDDTIKQNIIFGYDEKEVKEEDVWEALREAQLEEFVKGLPEGIETVIGEKGVRLSGGQRQRIGIARALFKKPELLVFDEATSALDNETEAAIIESINALKGKKTMIIIAHRLTTIQDCDILYRVQDGTIVRTERA